MSALLIVAAVGAMVLGHRERLNRRTQRQRSISRTRGLDGPVTTLPGPGVYALHDAVDRPALLPDGRPARNSVSAQYQATIDERLPVEYQREAEPLSPELGRGTAGRAPGRCRTGGGQRMNPGNYLLLAAALFSIGTVGVLVRRTAVVVFMSIELMLNAANLTLVTFSRLKGTLDGQVIAFFVMVVAAAEVVVGLAIILTIFRTRQSSSVDDTNLLKY